MKQQDREAKFWALVDRSGGDEACWPWLGGRRDGYGGFCWAGRDERAHRVALALDGRPVGPGLVGMHLCDNPICCNPRHLQVGTQGDNIADAYARGRMPKGRRLTLEQAAQVRAWYRKGLATSTELAALFGIGPQRVRHIGTDEPYKGMASPAQRGLFEAAGGNDGRA